MLLLLLDGSFGTVTLMNHPESDAGYEYIVIVIEWNGDRSFV